MGLQVKADAYRATSLLTSKSKHTDGHKLTSKGRHTDGHKLTSKGRRIDGHEMAQPRAGTDQPTHLCVHGHENATP